MKKVFKIFIFISILFIAVGCGNNNNKSSKEVNIPSNNSSDNIEFKLDDKWKVVKDFKCDALKDLKEFVPDTLVFITNDGGLYEYSFNQLFSLTEQNCQKVDTDKKIIKSVGRFIFDDDNNIYRFSSHQLYPSDYIDSNILIENIYYVGYDWNSQRDDFVILDHNKIYGYVYDMNSKEYIISNDPIFEIAGDIKYFNGFAIKTDSNYYTYLKEEENKDCHKYADIECKYIQTYQLEETQNFYDNVIYYGNGIIIDKDYNFYTTLLGG